jgi:hypothetical protein
LRHGCEKRFPLPGQKLQRNFAHSLPRVTFSAVGAARVSAGKNC